jgi:hypothetical protein
MGLNKRMLPVYRSCGLTSIPTKGRRWPSVTWCAVTQPLSLLIGQARRVQRSSVYPIARRWNKRLPRSCHENGNQPMMHRQVEAGASWVGYRATVITRQLVLLTWSRAAGIPDRDTQCRLRAQQTLLFFLPPRSTVRRGTRCLIASRISPSPAWLQSRSVDECAGDARTGNGIPRCAHLASRSHSSVPRCCSSVEAAGRIV